MKWNLEAKKSFNDTKKPLKMELVLVSPYFSKDFNIFYFSSEHTIGGILL